MSTTSNFSNVKIYPVKRENDSTLAFGSVVVSNLVQISFSVKTGKAGNFVAFPRHLGKSKTGEQKWFQDVFWLNTETRDAVQKLVLDEYEKVTNQNTSDTSTVEPF